VNYVYPSFLLKYFSGGILGIMISVIFAAAMSSIAGEIAALSSASMVDFYKRYFKPEASDAHYLRAGQISTLFWGVFATGAAFLLGSRGTSLVETVNTVGSHFYGPILGVFILAFFVKRASGTGAFISIILGMIAVISVSWFTKVSWLYLNVIGPFVVVTAGIIFSLIFPNRPKLEGEMKNSE
jgi:Na+/proline symporter